MGREVGDGGRAEVSILFQGSYYMELMISIIYVCIIIGGVSAASEATLSSSPLRFSVYVGGFSTCNQSLRR